MKLFFMLQCVSCIDLSMNFCKKLVFQGVTVGYIEVVYILVVLCDVLR